MNGQIADLLAGDPGRSAESGAAARCPSPCVRICRRERPSPRVMRGLRPLQPGWRPAAERGIGWRAFGGVAPARARNLAASADLNVFPIAQRAFGATYRWAARGSTLDRQGVAGE